VFAARGIRIARQVANISQELALTMIRGLYSADAAIETAQLNQELVAENLANAATPSYRRVGMLFAAPQAGDFDDTPDNRSIQGPRPGSLYTSFTPGSMQHTGNPLDVAISGDAFFVVDGPNGPLYTRNGAFNMNAQGELRTPSGLPVRGVGSRIVIPQNTTNIAIGKDGTVLADNVQVGQLQLAQFTDPNALRRAGTTLFEGPAPQTPTPGAATVEQGYREASNVQVVNEMVHMMFGMRQYEAAEKAMRALAETVGQHTKPG
jgi:flagellar basal body rod protein FlgG